MGGGAKVHGLARGGDFEHSRRSKKKSLEGLKVPLPPAHTALWANFVPTQNLLGFSKIYLSPVEDINA